MIIIENLQIEYNDIKLFDKISFEVHNCDRIGIVGKNGISKTEFDKDIREMSEEQKKKVLVAKSISEQANIYIWDEPLNYIDILTRLQIEEVLLNFKPTVIFVEHDETFIEKVATKIVCLENNVLKN